jgi:hypothetical protein
VARIDLANVDKKPRDEWRKWFAYLFNQEAKGANSRAILAVWYAWITAESGKTIYGNNPLNLTCSKGDGCYTGQNGHYRFAGNSRNFASFATPKDGARAVIGLLSIERYRYPAILNAARADNWQAMIEAIAHSCWVSCSRVGYVSGGNITLYSIWNRMRPLVDADVNSGAIGQIPATVEKQLGAFWDLISFPVGHILTKEDVNRIVDVVDKSGKIDGGFGTTSKAVALELIRGILMQHVGDAWTKTLQDTLQAKFNQAAGLSADAFVPDPLQGAADALKAIGELIAKLFDPQTYVRAGALILGLILALTGFKMLMDATTGTPVSV